MAKFRINPISAGYHLFRNDVHKLEYDPKAQFEFHRRMSAFWVCNFFLVIVVHQFFDHFWNTVSVLYLILVSLYANFATDYGAMPSSHAALKSDEVADAKDDEYFQY